MRMTNQEAIKTIEANYPPENYSMLREALNIAISLLKKQIPIEPELNEKHMYVNDAFKCGKCGAFIHFHYKYCQMCGQVVKWNDS